MPSNICKPQPKGNRWRIENLPSLVFQELIQAMDYPTFLTLMRSSKTIKQKFLGSKFRYSLPVKKLVIKEQNKEVRYLVRRNAFDAIKHSSLEDFNTKKIKLDVELLDIYLLGDHEEYDNAINKLRQAKISIDVLSVDGLLHNFNHVCQLVEEFSPKGIHLWNYSGLQISIFDLPGIEEMHTIKAARQTISEEQLLGLNAKALSLSMTTISDTSIMKMLKEWSEGKRELHILMIDLINKSKLVEMLLKTEFVEKVEGSDWRTWFQVKCQADPAKEADLIVQDNYIDFRSNEYGLYYNKLF